MTYTAEAAIALAAWILSLAATPLVIRAARRLNAIDEPDGCRKHQACAIPLGGGVALALSATLIVVAWVASTGAAGFDGGSVLVRGFLPAAAVLMVVGIIDDFVGLTGIYKLIGQMLAATLLAAGGAEFHVLGLAGGDFDLGSLALPFSVFFILGAINAFNLIDGSDGLAASVGVIVIATLAAIAGNQGNLPAATVGFAFAGALLGFLRYNWAPARIYLGDTGSMLIGLVTAYIAMDAMIKRQAAAALIVPLAGCAIPILDVSAALIRRITTGQSVFAPDRGHFHHALLLRGLSVRQTAAAAAGLTAVTCAGAVVSYWLGRDWPGIVAIVLVVGGLAKLRVFGHAEAELMATHARSGWSGLWRRVRRNAVVEPHTNHEINIQGSRAWQDLWSALRESAPKHGVCGLRLNINIPRLHESFYGNWMLREDGELARESHWRLVLPLNHEGEAVGRITVVGGPATVDEPFDAEGLALFLEPMRDEIRRILVGLGPQLVRTEVRVPVTASMAAFDVAGAAGVRN